MKVCVYTLGCRLNQAESEALIDSFSSAGFEIVKNNAELYIVNTCTVTSKAEQKARRMIRLFLREGASVLITGCYAEMNKEELEELGDNLVVVPLNKKASLLNLAHHINNCMISNISLLDSLKSFSDINASVFSYNASNFIFHSRAYLKIQDGCDNSCAFCRVSIARGKAVFLSPDEVIIRAKKLEEDGFNEIVLTGVNLTMYDHDNEGLGGLLLQLLPKLKKTTRIRLSSLEADNIDSSLIEALKDDRVYPYFHIPLQSMSEKVLSRVNRKASINQITNLVSDLKRVKEDPLLACDLIAGLPGETEEDALLTENRVKELGFSLIHTFPFSPRPDTPLYKAKDRVEERVRDERALRLRKLSDSLYDEYITRQLNKELEVLFESRKGGAWYGTTSNYLKVKIITKNIYSKGDIAKGILINKAEIKID